MPRAQKKEVAALRPMIDMKEIDWNKQQTEYEEHQMCKSNSAKKQACNDWFDNPDSNKKKHKHEMKKNIIDMYGVEGRRNTVERLVEIITETSTTR